MKSLLSVILSTLLLSSFVSWSDETLHSPDVSAQVGILAIDDVAKEEGGEPAIVMIFRLGDVSESLEVRYQIEGTAQNEIDYLPLFGVVTIPAGQYAVPVSLIPIDDEVAEGVEWVVLSLAGGNSETGISTEGISVREVRLKILDNDFETFQRPIVNMVRPGPGQTFFKGEAIRLAAGGFDVDGRIEKVEFFAGESLIGEGSPPPVIFVGEETFRAEEGALELVEAHLGQQTETVENVYPTGSSMVTHVGFFTLDWEHALPGIHSITAVATDDDGLQNTSTAVEIKVLDEERPVVVSVYARDPSAGEEGNSEGLMNTGLIRIERTGSTELPLEVFFEVGGSAERGVDYAEFSNTVIIKAGERYADLLVSPIDDQVVEGSETVVIEIQPPVCIEIFPQPYGCYHVGSNHRAVVNIRDNDEPSTENHPPVTQIVQPSHGSRIELGSVAQVIGSAYDLDGQVQKVEFYVDEMRVAVRERGDEVYGGTPASGTRIGDFRFQFEWSADVVGKHGLQFRAVDDDGAEAWSPTVLVTVAERVDLPAVSVEVLSSFAYEAELAAFQFAADGDELPTRNGVFRIRRTGSTGEALTVGAFLSGTASNGEDYHTVLPDVEIPAGETSIEVLIEPRDDLLVEGRESVNLSLVSSLANSLPDVERKYRVGYPSGGKVYIIDNDLPAEPSRPWVEWLSPSPGQIYHEGQTITMVVQGFDRDGVVKSVSFYDGEVLLGTVSASHLDEATGALVPEILLESIFRKEVQLSAGEHRLRVVATDNDGLKSEVRVREILVQPSHERSIVHVAPEDLEAHEVHPDQDFDGTATFLVTRSGPISDSLTVFYQMSGTAENGVDYEMLPGEVTFEEGQQEVRIVVRPIDDNVAEGNETVVISLVPPTCVTSFPPPPGCYLVGSREKTLVVIHDNDESINHPPIVRLTQPLGGERFPSGQAIGIEAHVLDPDGYVSRVEFYAGQQKIGEAVMHFFVEPDPGQPQRFSLLWPEAPAGKHDLRAKATDSHGVTTFSKPVEIVVREENAPPVVEIFARDHRAQETDEGAPDTGTFILKRRGDLSGSVTVMLNVSGSATPGADYQTLPSEVVFQPNQDSVELEVVPVDDNLPESTETVFVRLRYPGELDPSDVPDSDEIRGLPYEIAHSRKAVVVIQDNDRPSDELPPIPGEGAVGRLVGEGFMRLLIAGKDGDVVIVEISDDLTDWLPIGEAIVTNGVIDFIDPESAGRLKGFYRFRNKADLPLLQQGVVR